MRYDRRPLIILLVLFTLVGVAYLTSNAAPDWARPDSRDARYSIRSAVPITLANLIAQHRGNYDAVKRMYGNRWLIISGFADEIRSVTNPVGPGTSLVRATFDPSEHSRLASSTGTTYLRARCKAKISPDRIELANCTFVE